MDDSFRPLDLLLVTVAGWESRRQQRVIEYLVEENRVLREQLGGRVPPLTDDQRRRLAARRSSFIQMTDSVTVSIVTMACFQGGSGPASAPSFAGLEDGGLRITDTIVREDRIPLSAFELESGPHALHVCLRPTSTSTYRLVRVRLERRAPDTLPLGEGVWYRWPASPVRMIVQRLKWLSTRPPREVPKSR